MSLPLPKFPFGQKSVTGSNSSDLLQRVGAFLPKLQAANQALLEQEEDAHKIDATLEKDDEDDENEGSEQNNKSDDDDDDDDDCQVDDSKRVPTIQLKVGIGKVDENPIISFLASDDEDDADDGDDDEGEDADGDGVVSTEEDDAAADDEDVGQGTDSNVAVEPILSIKRKLVSGLRREDPPKSKRPLIQEM